MAESVTIARPYAEALFRAAKESGNLAKWSEQVSLLGQVAANPEAREAIGDPNVAAPQLVDLFRSACGTAVDAELANFIQLLSNNDRLGLLPEIAGLYESYKQAEEGTKQAEIVSAFPIDDFSGESPGPATRSRLQDQARGSSVGPDAGCFSPRQARRHGYGAEQLGEFHAVESFRNF
jgi:hypothetical protein